MQCGTEIFSSQTLQVEYLCQSIQFSLMGGQDGVWAEFPDQRWIFTEVPQSIGIDHRRS
jgi:hypothetical protein